MRLFIAIEAPEAVGRHLLRVQDALREVVGSGSWTREGAFHLTLKFLGEVAEGDVPALTDALGQVVCDGPIRLRTSGIVCFPPGRATAVVGVEVVGEGLLKLQQAVETRCAELGFPAERRVYRPHVTLARPRGRRNLASAAAQRAGTLLPGPWFDVDHFALIQSLLKPQGAQYVCLARFALGRGPAGGT
jgi:2'-5' RNA ligase